MIDIMTEIGTTVRKVLKLTDAHPLEIIPIVRGGSVRSFYRVRYGNQATVIFVSYSRERQENTYYASQTAFLHRLGVAAPEIFYHDGRRGFILMEDLGERDLWFYRREAWGKRRGYYFRTLDMIRKLHVLGPGDPKVADVPLMEAFDQELYRWERSYFLEHFVGTICGLEPGRDEGDDLEEELALLAARLAGMRPCLLHRDLQSQNVMIREDEPVLIDYQGMRYGNPCYDLGSLLYDPYVDFAGEEREELLRHYYDGLPVAAYSRDFFWEMFRLASVQRLMQALGAYGFLGQKRNLPEFLTYIPAGLDRLLTITDDEPQFSRLRELALRCRDVLGGQKKDL